MFNSKKKQELLEAKVDALYDEFNRMAKAINQIGMITKAAVNGLDGHTIALNELNKNLHLISEQQNKIVSKIMRSENKGDGHESDTIH
jgi:hypothetical protein